MARILIWCVAILGLFQSLHGDFTNIVTTGRTSCSADFCNPNWTPYENMVSALRGYNLRQGNPLDKNFDPGFKNQIFVPTVLNKEEKTISLASGITASDLSNCKRKTKSNAFSNFDSYSNHVMKSAESGMDLQIGVEREVSVGVNIKGVEASSTSTIPPPFQRGWRNSENMESLRSFFSKKKGIVTTSVGICLSYQLRLQQFRYPPFTDSFKNAIQELYSAYTKPKQQVNVFKKFVSEFGTHFLLHTALGAEFIHETKYSGDVRRHYNVDTLQKCSEVAGSKIFGLQVEEDSKKCTESDKKNLGGMSRSDVEDVVITRGSRPTNIKDWSTQDFKPVPIQFTLSPIVNLFTNSILKRNNIKVGGHQISDSLKIRSWFLPLYWDYCKVIGVECKTKEGCGIDDKCPVDAICNPSTNKHQCTEWTNWRCTGTCSAHEERHRTCTGCDGQTKQKRASSICKPASCYKDKILTLGEKYGSWKSWEHCPSGSWVVSFQTKVERDQGSGSIHFTDDSALNAILMTCSDRLFTKISSGQGGWGEWRGESTMCRNGFSRFKLKIEEDQGYNLFQDDSTTNAIRMWCTENKTWYKSGEGAWGEWTPTEYCPTGYRITGIKTQIESNQGGGDDTALNGVQLICKYFGN